MLSERVLVTAAHCFRHAGQGFQKDSKIRVGDQILNDQSDDIDAQTHEISAIIGHPDYFGFEPDYDIAIILTKTEIEFNTKVQPIKILDPKNFNVSLGSDRSAMFAGWGMFDSTLETSDPLREAKFEVLDPVECESHYNYTGVNQIFYCAQNQSKLSWTCPGDSGSPLIRHGPNHENHLIGLLYGSASNCQDGYQKSSIFANLAHQEIYDFVNKWRNISLTQDWIKAAKTAKAEYILNLNSNIRVNCHWSDWGWGPWSTCTTTCGGGTQIRMRNLLIQAENYDYECDTTDGIQERRCNIQACICRDPEITKPDDPEIPETEILSLPSSVSQTGQPQIYAIDGIEIVNDLNLDISDIQIISVISKKYTGGGNNLFGWIKSGIVYTTQWSFVDTLATNSRAGNWIFRQVINGNTEGSEIIRALL